jgi:hypothetical protein
MPHGAIGRCALSSHHHPARLGCQPAPADRATDPLSSPTAIANNPSSILGAIPEPIPRAGRNNAWFAATFDQQSCDYYRRAQNQVCQKTLTVRVD